MNCEPGEMNEETKEQGVEVDSGEMSDIGEVEENPETQYPDWLRADLQYISVLEGHKQKYEVEVANNILHHQQFKIT